MPTSLALFAVAGSVYAVTATTGASLSVLNLRIDFELRIESNQNFCVYFICEHTSKPSIPGIAISVKTSLKLLEQQVSDNRFLKQFTAWPPDSKHSEETFRSLSMALRVIKLKASSSQIRVCFRQRSEHTAISISLIDCEILCNFRHEKLNWLFINVKFADFYCTIKSLREPPWSFGDPIGKFLSVSYFIKFYLICLNSCLLKPFIAPFPLILLKLGMWY